VHNPDNDHEKPDTILYDPNITFPRLSRLNIDFHIFYALAGPEHSQGQGCRVGVGIGPAGHCTIKLTKKPLRPSRLSGLPSLPR